MGITMEYIKGTTSFHIEDQTVVSFGKFDGLHLGHELLMEKMLAKKKTGLKSGIFTFDIPPRRRAFDVEAKVLTTNEEKMHLFERIGIDYLIECPFTEEIMCMDAADFVKKIVTELNVKAMIVGTDFYFGHNRGGDYHTLQQYADELGYEVSVVDKMQYENRDISSTFVREEIAAGNMERANHLLGYHYFVQGKVEHGNHLGGPVLSCPTVNLLPAADKLLPPNGVYVAEVVIGDQICQGIANVGCKPTIEGKNPIGVETHIFDFDKDLYGTMIRVEFLSRVRAEQKFASIEELRAQLQEDIAYGRSFFKQY